MDWSLLLFIVVMLFFAYRGYKKGLFKSLSRILSLVAGYIAAILYAGPFSAVLGSQYQLQGIVGFLAAALILFFSAVIAVSILFWILAKLLPATDSPSTASSLGGATVGLVIGVIVAIAIIWTYAFVRDIHFARDAEANFKPGKIERLASNVASKVVNSALSMGSARPEITNLGTALIASPAEIAQHARRLSSSNDLNELLRDPDNQALLNRGDVAAVKNLPALRKLARNPDMLALAKYAGIVDDSANNSDAVETALATQLTDIWGRVHRVRNDRRVQEILNDPEFQQKIQSGNPIDLLTNARLLELADIIYADEAAPSGAGQVESNSVQPESSRQPSSEEKMKIFSWVDEDGRIHYSDTEGEP
ncbi:MAG: CvpA family protein [Gammaproteobacteria bacterium]|nr:CvpA family protein [Gammaproteobacteria bacterium]